MKTLNTAIITAILALGFAGTSMAAPGHSDNYKLKQYSHQKQKVVKHSGKRAVVQKHVKRAPAKRVVKRIAKQVIYKKVKQMAKPSKSRSYRVKPGDTLARIAKRNRVSLNHLIRVNKLWGHKANHLRVGMIIRLR